MSEKWELKAHRFTGRTSIAIKSLKQFKEEEK
jgi:hypothetical protein